MPFFNVDDQFHSHPKARKAGLIAVGLWTVAGSWSQAYKQQGFVPAHVVAAWPQGRKAADALVRAGLWSEGINDDGDRGWWFHDWLDIHPTAEEIEKQREKARDRQRKRRARLHSLRDEAEDAS